jgi:hypothetical protein
MWLALSRSFISVVADRGNPDRLLVRARVAGHIEAVFPKAEVFTDAEADYYYRAFIDREEVAQKLSEEVREIDYDNFKASVPDQPLHDSYVGVWRVMHKLQDSLTADK